jgi:pimeloyl-ACP methyl ester carboxylesterase
MPVVLVHGVPETHHLWDDLRTHLARVQSIAVALPGFGNPAPDGFAASMDDYAAWLIAELEAVGEAVHLVGHVWGGILTLRVASLRPDLLTSWASDALGVFDPSFQWHALAKVWQTPGAGEDFMTGLETMTVHDRASTFVPFGVPQAKAEEMASWWDTTMARCILALYRSATDVAGSWGSALDGTKVPGLALRPGEDPFADGAAIKRVLARTGARPVTLDGLGHWWPLQDPARGAEVLERFWAA